jgi:APA family basic amino acid/polyamine antiporter
LETQPNNLERKLGLFPVTNIVIANMIGAGIFTTSGLLMADLHHPWLLLLLWFVGGIIALSGALCYGEVGAAIPEAGGEYIFLSRLYHPMLGFLSGWVSFIVGFSAPIAASAIGFSAYLYRAVPGIFTFGAMDVEMMKKVYSVLIILVFTIIHLRGMKFGAVIQNYLTTLKVALIVFLIIIGFAAGTGSFAHFHESTVPGHADFQWRTVGLSLMWIMFAYSGWNASVYIGGEIRNPETNLPKSLLIGTGGVLLLYLLLNALFIYAIKPAEMGGVISIGGLAVRHMFGTTSENLVSLLIAFALFSSISAFIILGPRVYFAMARDGYFFKFARQIHPRYKVPYLSVIFQGLISMVIVLSGTFDQILTYMGFALGIFPILVIFALFKLRKAGKTPLKLPGYPFTALLYIFAAFAMLGLSFVERPVESGIALLTVGAGVPAYAIFDWIKKKEARM